MTSQERREVKQTRTASLARIRVAQEQTRAVVASGKCPDCGAGIHQNITITGWYQCDRSGSSSFRRDPSGAHCTWQGFTE